MKLFKRTDKQKKAYEQAKAETLLKYPTMVEFFKLIERAIPDTITGAETPTTSDIKKE